MAKSNSLTGATAPTPPTEGAVVRGAAAALPFRRAGNDEAAVVRVAGPVTAQTMRAVLREVQSTHVTQSEFRLLLDFRAAIVMLSEEEWEQWTTEWLRSSRSDISLGFVTGLEATDPIDRYVFAAMMRGQITLAWTQARGAYAWLALH